MIDFETMLRAYCKAASAACRRPDGNEMTAGLEALEVLLTGLGFGLERLASHGWLNDPDGQLWNVEDISEEPVRVTDPEAV